MNQALELILITLDASLPNGNHRHEGMREVKRFFLLMLSAKQGRHWHQFVRLWYGGEYLTKGVLT